MAVPDTEGDAFPAVSQHSFRGAGLLGEQISGTWILPARTAGLHRQRHLAQLHSPGPCVPVNSDDRICNTCKIICHLTDLFVK